MQKFAVKCEIEKELKQNAVDEEKRLNLISKKKDEFANATAEHAKDELVSVVATAEAAKARADVRRVLVEFHKETFVEPSSDTHTKQFTNAETSSDDFLSVEGNSTKTSQEFAEISGSFKQISQESSETIDDLKLFGTILCCLNMEDCERTARTNETLLL